MPIYRGGQKIKDIYCGSQAIKEVYRGSQLVYKKNMAAKFVILGGSKVVYSDNAINWTEGPALPASGPWKSISYGNELFASAATGTKVGIISEDGKTWTRVDLPNSYTHDIVFGNGRFVTGGEIIASSYTTDFQSWTSPPVPDYMNVMRFVNGKFVVLKYGSNSVYFSTNGAGWDAANTPAPTFYAVEIAFGNGVYVATQNSTSYLAASSTPQLWNYGTMPLNLTAHQLVFGGGKFVGVNGTTFVYSTNGASWSSGTLPVSAKAIAYGHGLFVAVEPNSTNVAYSANGTAWTKAPALPTSANWTAIGVAD
jgi:hypothetical protein